MWERLLGRVASLIGIGVFIFLVAVLTTPSKAPDYCLRAFRSAYPDLAQGAGVVGKVWARTQDDHWLSALLVQPSDIAQSRVTVVCHFASTNFVEGRVEVIPGDRIRQLKDVSTSNLAPTTWFK
jgi:hypothetical protein